MPARVSTALRHAYNRFVDDGEGRVSRSRGGYGPVYGSRPDRIRVPVGNEKSIVTSIFTRMAVDLSMMKFRHVRVDEEDRFVGEMNTGLNNCLKVEANVDQSPSYLIRDCGYTMFTAGTAAIVPVDMTLNPEYTAGWDILTMRVGRVIDWFPDRVRVDLYNERTGLHEQIVVKKSETAIIDNPLYAIMNEPNSTLQRLIRKLALLDSVDEAAASGKLDVIMQMPFTVRGDVKRAQAERRRKDLEDQLTNGRHGIGWVDATEKITQLNRPVDNNLLRTIEYLAGEVYGQLGLTPEIMNGTADEATMLNYYNRTIGPFTKAITEEMHRKFLTKTARTQRQAIAAFRDPFANVPMAQLADIADKFTRNEIFSSNDMRQFIGVKPSKDPKADELRNANINPMDTAPTQETETAPAVNP